MYKVLIAEDEMLVRMGLKNSVNWNAFDMTVIADVSDGKSAWEAYLRESPDLLILDIRMPVMDGMELIEKVRENDKKTKIIILTCMEEFDLAQKALNFGVLYYILKLTMTFQEIEDILRKVADELNGNHIHSNLPFERTDINILKQNCFRDFIINRNIDIDEFESDIRKLSIRLKSEKLNICLIEIDYYEKFKASIQNREGQRACISFVDILYEILNNCGRGEVFYITENRYALVFSFYEKNCEEEIYYILNNIIERIKKTVNDYFNLSVTFGISKIYNGYSNLQQLYIEAENAVNLKFIAEPGKIFLYDKKQESIYQQNAKKIIMELLKELEDIEIANDRNMRKSGVYLGYVIKQGFATKDQYIQILIDFMDHIALELPESVISKTIISATEKLRFCESLQEAIELIQSYAWQISEFRDKGQMLSREIAEVIRFISENYDQDISLHHIAEVVGLSSNYLCSLFKKEIGTGIIDYIIQVRIKKAKTLLTGTNFKSYQIAEMTGFTDSAYFSRLFKKVTGVNPNDFRKKFLISGLKKD